MSIRLRTSGLDNTTGQFKFYKGSDGDTIMGVPGSNLVLMDFGTTETDITIVTVPATWVTVDSIIRVGLSLKATEDHDSEDYIVEELKVYTLNIIAGVSFDIILHAPNNSFGKYYVNYISNSKT